MNEFPHQSGDYTVIGPECFTDADAQVITYKGNNYVRAREGTNGAVIPPEVRRLQDNHAAFERECPPVNREAGIQHDGDSHFTSTASAEDEINRMLLDNTRDPDWVARWCNGHAVVPEGQHYTGGPIVIEFETREGKKLAWRGDTIVKHADNTFTLEEGNHYPTQLQKETYADWLRRRNAGTLPPGPSYPPYMGPPTFG